MNLYFSNQNTVMLLLKILGEERFILIYYSYHTGHRGYHINLSSYSNGKIRYIDI